MSDRDRKRRDDDRDCRTASESCDRATSLVPHEDLDLYDTHLHFEVIKRADPDGDEIETEETILEVDVKHNNLDYVGLLGLQQLVAELGLRMNELGFRNAIRKGHGPKLDAMGLGVMP